jgi:hypothetical protein
MADPDEHAPSCTCDEFAAARTAPSVSTGGPDMHARAHSHRAYTTRLNWGKKEKKKKRKKNSLHQNKHKTMNTARYAFHDKHSTVHIPRTVAATV